MNSHHQEIEHPVLEFESPDGKRVTIYFGYLGEERMETCAVTTDDATILIPRTVLQMAAEQGWGECPYCKAGKEHPAEASH